MNENPYRAPAVAGFAARKLASRSFIARTLFGFAVLNSSCAAILAASLAWSRLVLLSLPISWPFFIIFGCDETTEIYGRYGELWRAWVSSIPVTMALAIVASLRPSLETRK
jgi:hypothetical protein